MEFCLLDRSWFAASKSSSEQDGPRDYSHRIARDLGGLPTVA